MPVCGRGALHQCPECAPCGGRLPRRAQGCGRRRTAPPGPRVAQRGQGSPLTCYRGRQTTFGAERLVDVVAQSALEGLPHRDSGRRAGAQWQPFELDLQEKLGGGVFQV